MSDMREEFEAERNKMGEFFAESMSQVEIDLMYAGYEMAKHADESRIAQLEKYKTALEDQYIVHGNLWPDETKSPYDQIGWLLTLNQEWALDPKISPEVKELYDRITQLAKEVERLNNQSGSCHLCEKLEKEKAELKSIACRLSIHRHNPELHLEVIKELLQVLSDKPSSEGDV